MSPTRDRIEAAGVMIAVPYLVAVAQAQIKCPGSAR